MPAVELEGQQIKELLDRIKSAPPAESAALAKMLRFLVGGPIVTWKNNSGSDAAPPADLADWLEIIAQAVGRTARVELVSHGRDQWRVSVADQLRVNVGPGPWETAPLDLRAEVKAALRAAAKPIVD